MLRRGIYSRLEDSSATVLFYFLYSLCSFSQSPWLTVYTAWLNISSPGLGEWASLQVSAWSAHWEEQRENTNGNCILLGYCK